MQKQPMISMLEEKIAIRSFIAKLCLVLAWALYCIITYGTSLSSFFIGPLWLIGRGQTPTIFGLLTLILFGLFALLLVFHKSRISVILAMLLIPAWLVVGVCANNLADW
jgi:hypothetical protein